MKKLWIPAILLSLLALSGCATNIHGPELPPIPTQVFKQYDVVELTPVSVDANYAEARANKRARSKIEDNLYVEHLKVFPNLKRVGRGEQLTAREDILRIEPHIEAIKFVSGGARFWWGGMAGSSAVRMVVTYRDMGTGEVVDAPLFYSRADAYGGGWSMGATDNIMLLRIARDITKYSATMLDKDYRAE